MGEQAARQRHRWLALVGCAGAFGQAVEDAALEIDIGPPLAASGRRRQHGAGARAAVNGQQNESCQVAQRALLGLPRFTFAPLAVPLVGYMAWPNDPIMRERWLEAHQCNDQPAINGLMRRLKVIQQHCARVADIVHRHYDLAHGQHLERRGGASVSKAIALIEAEAKSKGTGRAKLWEIWKTYKDVGHLVTAVVMVAADALTR